VVELMDVLTVF